MTDNAVASTSKDGGFVEPAAPTKKPRPKPKKKPPTGSIDGVPSAPPSDFAPTVTTIQRTALTTVPSELIPEFPLPDIPLTIADRAKSRARNAKSKPVVQDIIDIASDEDEQLLRLSPHRPKQKAVRGAKSRPIPNPPPPSSHPSQESLVTPTSDFQPAPAVSSQLPPSDPPSSTLPLPISTPESAKKRRQLPYADDADESPPKKQKHQRVDTDNEDNSRTHAPPPRGMAFDPPPPNFFASSSSSLPPPPAPLVRGELGKKKAVKRKQATDDPPPPEVVDPDPPKVGKSRPKPKKKSGVHPEPNEVGKSSPIPTTTSRSRSNAKAPVYKSADTIGDSDEEGGSLVLPPPPRISGSESPLSDLPETIGSNPSKSITPSTSRKRLVPEVVITTVPRKRTSSLAREVEERGADDKNGADESPKGKKRQKQTAEEDYFVGLDDEIEVAPKKGPKGKRKAPPKGKGRTKPQPTEPVGDEEFQEVPPDDPAEMSGKAKTKVKLKVTKSARPNKSRILDSDNEATADAAIDDTLTPPQDARVSLGFAVSPPTISTCGLQEDQENTLPSPEPAKSKPNPPVTPSSVSRKTPVPTSASSFARLNYGHSLASDEKPMSMAEIIRKANSNAGTPTGIKPHSSLMKGSRSALKRIAPLHARRKTPPPLPPKPPPPKKTKKQLELEEKWEEELEETIEGWAALSSQEREVLRKQKRDMEMGYED